jgi:hypothetical protein
VHLTVPGQPRRVVDRERMPHIIPAGYLVPGGVIEPAGLVRYPGAHPIANKRDRHLGE